MVSGGDRDWISGRVGEYLEKGYHMERAPLNLHGSQPNSGYIERKWNEGLQGWSRAADGWVGAWEELMGLWRSWR